MIARANPRTGLMTYDSSRCDEGKEITTYDSLDESLGQARANTYLAVKCWATWLALDFMSRLRIVAGDIPAEPREQSWPNSWPATLISFRGRRDHSRRPGEK